MAPYLAEHLSHAAVVDNDSSMSAAAGTPHFARDNPPSIGDSGSGAEALAGKAPFACNTLHELPPFNVMQVHCHFQYIECTALAASIAS